MSNTPSSSIAERVARRRRARGERVISPDPLAELIRAAKEGELTDESYSPIERCDSAVDSDASDEDGPFKIHDILQCLSDSVKTPERSVDSGSAGSLEDFVEESSEGPSGSDDYDDGSSSAEETGSSAEDTESSEETATASVDETESLEETGTASTVSSAEEDEVREEEDTGTASTVSNVGEDEVKEETQTEESPQAE